MKNNIDVINIQTIIDLTLDNIPFSTAKFNHGFWELRHKTREFSRTLGFDPENLEDSQWKKSINDYPLNHSNVDVFLEVNRYLINAHNYSNILTLTSITGWKNGERWEGTPYVGVDEVNKEISRTIDYKEPLFDGTLWKNSVIDGSFYHFIKMLRTKKVLIIGPEYIRYFSEFAKLNDAGFVEVDARKSALKREETVQKILSYYEKNSKQPLICLFETGGLNTAWFIYRLHNEMPNCWLHSLGQVLDLCRIDLLSKVNWTIPYRKEISDTIISINPEWPNSDKAWGNNSKLDSYSIEWESFSKGLDFILNKKIKNELKKEYIKSKRPVDFIENKQVDYKEIEQILDLSKQRNHWANFGPVTHLLEEYVHEKLSLSNDRQVIMCKSGTAAINTLVNLFEIKAQKKIKWVISSFGFISSNTGRLHNATVIDCDEHGLLDINLLKKLPKDSWDAILFTNTFSVCQDISPWVNLCNKLNKKIIIDNAVGLDSRWRHKNPEDEAISFHQTKPWGMGEAGCLIIDRKDEELARSLICFGLGGSSKNRQYYNNEKLADVNSALILQRLLSWPIWSRKYYFQFRRITKLAMSLGLEPMVRWQSEVTLANIPFLSKNKISKKHLKNPFFVMQKYYKPLEKGHPMSESIYSHIINVPCHSGMFELSDEEIISGLEFVLNKSSIELTNKECENSNNTSGKHKSLLMKLITTIKK